MIARKLRQSMVLLVVLLITAGVYSCGKTEKEGVPSASRGGSENDEMEQLRKIGSENYTGYYLGTWDKPHETSAAIQTAKTKLSQICPAVKTAKAQQACKTYQEVVDKYEETIAKVIEVYDRYRQNTDEWLQLQRDWNAAEAKVKLEAGKVNIDEVKQARAEASELNKKRLEVGKAAGDYKKEFQELSCAGPGIDRNRPECPGYEFRTKVADLLK